MRALQLVKWKSDPEFVELPKPTPGPGEVVIKIGGASIPSDVMPRYIVVEGLEIRSARPPYTFTDDSGNAGHTFIRLLCGLPVDRADSHIARALVKSWSTRGLIRYRVSGPPITHCLTRKLPSGAIY